MKNKKIPRKYQPRGYEILYEDKDVILGDKAAGILTVAALWNNERTVQSALNEYVRKGNSRSRKCVYVVHRLDQATSGILIFAKNKKAQIVLQDNWKKTKKNYYAVVHGYLKRKSGMLSSYLFEGDNYVMHSTLDKTKGKLAQTAYKVLKEMKKMSLIQIDLLTGKKNQIRVQFADLGHPLVGDTKYGKPEKKKRPLALFSSSISFNHPVTHSRLTFEAKVPVYFQQFFNAS